MTAATLLLALVVGVGHFINGSKLSNLSSLSNPSNLEVIAAVRVHGNVLTPDADILQIARLEAGAPLGPDTLVDAEARLRAAGRFERVEVLKRFESISDPTQILVVIVVDEGPVRIERTGDPARPVRIVKSRARRVLLLPLLDVEEGYGLSYGARLTVPNLGGTRSRLSTPLTWGGSKRAGIEWSRQSDEGPISRVEAGGAVSRRTHPFFREDEDRVGLWGRGERQVAHSLRVGAGGEWQHVAFLDRDDRFVQVGGDIVWDTRVDPFLARNAVYARAAWNHVDARSSGGVNRTSLEGRGYIALMGQTVLVVRGVHEGANRPLPAYLQPILGGGANLRGFRAGTAVGDELAAGSLELRVPLSSPLSIGRVGVSVFTDAGAVYGSGQRLGGQEIRKGVGAGVWFAAAFVHVNVAVAHGLGAGTRVHVGTNLLF